jgi:hypothetical protein
MRPSTLLCVLWLLPSVALAQSQGVALYERGEYAQARRALELELRDQSLGARERAAARLYLAASLYELGEETETQVQLRELWRSHPEQPVDPALFPPEFVALAGETRRQVTAELQPSGTTSPWEPTALSSHSRLLPEVFGFMDPVGKAVGVGGGLTYGAGSFEVGARALLGRQVGVGLQLGLVLGDGAFRPHVALRGTAIPGLSAYGGGPVVGARFALGTRLTALVDVGAELFKVSEAGYRSFALTTSVGLGFDLMSP